MGGSCEELIDVFCDVERSAVLSPAAKRLFVHLWIEAGCRSRAVAFDAREFAEKMAADVRTVRRALELLSRAGRVEVFAGGRQASEVKPLVADKIARAKMSVGGPNCAQKCPPLTNDTNARAHENHPSACTNESPPIRRTIGTRAGTREADQIARGEQKGPLRLGDVVAESGGVAGLVEQTATRATMRRNHWSVRLCQALEVDRQNYLVTTTLRLLDSGRLEGGQLADVLWQLSSEAQQKIGKPIANRPAVFRAKMQRRGYAEFGRRRQA